MDMITSPIILDRTFSTKTDITNYYLSQIAEGLGKSPKRYGIRIDLNNSDPDTRVEYIYDAIGMSPAYMDFTNGAFNYGDWKNIWFIEKNFPCMVKFDGTVDYKLNPNNYSIKENGSASDFSNVEYLGNAMSAIPLIWKKEYTPGGYKYKIFCQIQYDDSYKAYAFTRPDNTISDYMYYPMVKGSLDSSNRLRSIGGARPQSSTTASQEKSYASNCGSAWTLITWQAWNLIMDLQELISKSTNRQAKFGEGHSAASVYTAEAFLNTGSLSTMGQFYGYNTTDNAVKTFHIENLYAERWDRCEGMAFVDGVWKVKDTVGTDGYNFNATGYTALSNGHPSNAGYIITTYADEHGDFPLTIGGSSDTYECDYYYQNTSGVCIPLVGGGCTGGSRVGRFVYVNADASYSGWDFGGSPFLINPS